MTKPKDTRPGRAQLEIKCMGLGIPITTTLQMREDLRKYEVESGLEISYPLTHDKLAKRARTHQEDFIPLQPHQQVLKLLPQPQEALYGPLCQRDWILQPDGRLTSKSGSYIELGNSPLMKNREKTIKEDSEHENHGNRLSDEENDRDNFQTNGVDSSGIGSQEMSNNGLQTIDSYRSATARIHEGEFRIKLINQPKLADNRSASLQKYSGTKRHLAPIVSTAAQWYKNVRLDGQKLPKSNSNQLITFYIEGHTLKLDEITFICRALNLKATDGPTLMATRLRTYLQNAEKPVGFDEILKRVLSKQPPSAITPKTKINTSILSFEANCKLTEPELFHICAFLNLKTNGKRIKLVNRIGDYQRNNKQALDIPKILRTELPGRLSEPSQPPKAPIVQQPLPAFETLALGLSTSSNQHLTVSQNRPESNNHISGCMRCGTAQCDCLSRQYSISNESWRSNSYSSNREKLSDQVSTHEGRYYGRDKFNQGTQTNIYESHYYGRDNAYEGQQTYESSSQVAVPLVSQTNFSLRNAHEGGVSEGLTKETKPVKVGLMTGYDAAAPSQVQTSVKIEFNSTIKNLDRSQTSQDQDQFPISKCGHLTLPEVIHVCMFYNLSRKGSHIAMVKRLEEYQRANKTVINLEDILQDESTKKFPKRKPRRKQKCQRCRELRLICDRQQPCKRCIADRIQGCTIGDTSLEVEEDQVDIKMEMESVRMTEKEDFDMHNRTIDDMDTCET